MRGPRRPSRTNLEGRIALRLAYRAANPPSFGDTLRRPRTSSERAHRRSVHQEDDWRGRDPVALCGLRLPIVGELGELALRRWRSLPQSSAELRPEGLGTTPNPRDNTN